jgi:hypothetical protein
MQPLKSIIHRYRPSWAALVMVATFALLALAGMPTTWAIVAGLAAGLATTLVLTVLRPQGPGRWTE